MSIYLIRHAQSEFNAIFDPDKPDPMIFDAPITELGRRQAIEARRRVRRLDISDVIVSPFTRTLQTAELIFENSFPFRINADVREQLCNSCDVGSSPGNLARKYPHIDFDHLDDCWWHDGDKDHRGLAVEPNDVLNRRALKFRRWLISNQIQSTAIVTHGNFIHALTGVKPDNCEIIPFDLG